MKAESFIESFIADQITLKKHHNDALAATNNLWLADVVLMYPSIKAYAEERFNKREKIIKWCCANNIDYCTQTIEDVCDWYNSAIFAYGYATAFSFENTYKDAVFFLKRENQLCSIWSDLGCGNIDALLRLLRVKYGTRNFT